MCLFTCRNPSTGLDSIYQKHVWSRLGTVEPPESSDTDGQAQVTPCLQSDVLL